MRMELGIFFHHVLQIYSVLFRILTTFLRVGLMVYSSLYSKRVCVCVCVCGGVCVCVWGGGGGGAAGRSKLPY